MSYTSATVVLGAADLPDSVGHRRIRAVTDADANVCLYIDQVSILVGIDDPAPQLADAVLAAVTEWHAEIHRRGHGDPIESGAPDRAQEGTPS